MLKKEDRLERERVRTLTQNRLQCSETGRRRGIMGMTSIVIRDRNDAAPLVLADAALNDGMASLPDMVCVGDKIDTDMQEGFLRCEACEEYQSS